MHRFGALGLVAASTCAIIVQTLLLQRALMRKLPDLTLLPILGSTGKVLLGATIMGIIIRLSWFMLTTHAHLAPRLNDLIAVFGLIPLGIGVYAGALWMLKIEGAEEIAAVLARWKRRGASTP